MERDQVSIHDHQNYSSPVPFLAPSNKQFTTSPKKPPHSSSNNNNNNNGNDRLKRDEWSEGAVSTLLEAYESKWTLRNRAKLKGQDWEDVASQVSGRSNNTKSAKTQTQCKNKIESMKKRYRSESAAADVSSWPLYPRLDLLLRGNGPMAAAAAAAVPAPAVTLEQSQPLAVPQMQNSHGSNGVDRIDKVDDHNNIRGKSVDQEPPEKNPIIDSDSSTPAVNRENKAKSCPSEKMDDEKKKKKKKKKKKNKRKSSEEHCGIEESVRWVARVVARCEEARMETMKEIERMRAEADVKRGEMDLKRTEIIANTQLEIAKLFANKGGPVDSPNLRSGRS